MPKTRSQEKNRQKRSADLLAKDPEFLESMKRAVLQLQQGEGIPHEIMSDRIVSKRPGKLREREEVATAG